MTKGVYGMLSRGALDRSEAPIRGGDIRKKNHFFGTPTELGAFSELRRSCKNLKLPVWFTVSELRRSWDPFLEL
jgi:hypothetical protein